MSEISELGKSPVETYRFSDPSEIWYDTALILGFLGGSLIVYFVDLVKMEGDASLDVCHNM